MQVNAEFVKELEEARIIITEEFKSLPDDRATVNTDGGFLRAIEVFHDILTNALAQGKDEDAVAKATRLHIEQAVRRKNQIGANKEFFLAKTRGLNQLLMEMFDY